MPLPTRDNQKAARVLVDAALYGDRTSCARNKVTDRTLRNYRVALDTDIELSGLYAQLSRLVTTQNWADELNTSLTGLIHKLGTMVAELPSSTAENISAVTGAIKALSEIALTREVLGSANGEVTDAGDSEPNQGDAAAGR